MTLDDAALIALARELPVALPSRTQREEVRTAVFAARARLAMLGGSGRVRASMLVVGTLASAAGVALALAVPTAPRAIELHGEPHETVQVVATAAAPGSSNEKTRARGRRSRLRRRVVRASQR